MQRTCTAAFSSSSRVMAEEPKDAITSEAFFDDLLKESTLAGDPSLETVDSGPPTPPSESFPRTTHQPNPVTEAKNQRVGQPLERYYAVSVKASRNNTIVTFARPSGNQLITLTGGKLGFKKSNRNGYEAGYQCAVGIIAAMENESKRVASDAFRWELFLNGFGQGREAMLTAITTAVGAQVKPTLKRVTDRTPLKIGGTRGQKARRV